MTRPLYPFYTQGTLHPQTQAVLEEIAASDEPPIASLTPQQVREQPSSPSWLGTPHPEVGIDHRTIERSASGIPIRIYTPQAAGARPLPILVFYHGGGFVCGSMDDFDPCCTQLAARVSCIVVSVEYRLAPEAKYPAAVDDASSALNWVATHAPEFNGDPSRIAVAGDSAGGNLAAVTSLVAREQGFPQLVLQVLICAWVDSSSFETDSFRYFGDGVWLSKAVMCWFRDHYLADSKEALHPHVSPLLAEDVNGLPPALVITAEFDVLRDQAEAYARRLQESGVAVQLTRYAGVVHDFVLYPGVFDRATEAIDEITTALKNSFSQTQP
jgi:acetyl esterase